jgi:hypothetical protein
VLFGHVHSSGRGSWGAQNADRVDLEFMFRFLFRLLARRCCIFPFREILQRTIAQS